MKQYVSKEELVDSLKEDPQLLDAVSDSYDNIKTQMKTGNYKEEDLIMVSSAVSMVYATKYIEEELDIEPNIIYGDEGFADLLTAPLEELMNIFKEALLAPLEMISLNKADSVMAEYEEQFIEYAEEKGYAYDKGNCYER